MYADDIYILESCGSHKVQAPVAFSHVWLSVSMKFPCLGLCCLWTIVEMEWWLRVCVVVAGFAEVVKGGSMSHSI